MRDYHRLVYGAKFVIGIPVLNHTGAAPNGDWVSMKLYGHATIVIFTGAIAVGAAQMDVAVEQATTVGGAGVKYVDFSTYYSGVVSTTSDTFTAAATTRVVGVSADFPIVNTDDDAMFLCEIDAEDLDVDGGFDCIRVTVSTPGAEDTFYGAMYILGQPRFESTQLAANSAIVN